MSKGSILYVEDDHDWHNRAIYSLQINGWELHHHIYARNAMEAIEDGLEYGLAIIDLDSSDGQFQLNGDDVMDCSKERNPKIHIITMSNYNRKDPKSKVHINKLHPFDPRKLIGIVNINYNFSGDVDAEEYYKNLIRE